jgi:hypothetical protein
MKKILLAATALVICAAMKAQTKGPDDVIKMNIEKYDFGKIKQGSPVTYFFEITNKSDKPVVVENSWGSCGCTTPEKPDKPIEPGQTAKLKVQYNAAALGHFDKDVYIKLAGVDQPKNVKITGETLEASAYDTYIKQQGSKDQNSVTTNSTTSTTTTVNTTTNTTDPKTNTHSSKTKTKTSKSKTKSGK